MNIAIRDGIRTASRRRFLRTLTLELCAAVALLWHPASAQDELPTATPTPATECHICQDQPCGPPCPDGSSSGICASNQESGCACAFVGCGPSPCAECTCTGDRDGDGRVTIDEIVA